MGYQFYSGFKPDISTFDYFGWKLNSIFHVNGWNKKFRTVRHACKIVQSSMPVIDILDPQACDLCIKCVSWQVYNPDP